MIELKIMIYVSGQIVENKNREQDNETLPQTSKNFTPQFLQKKNGKNRREIDVKSTKLT